MSYNDFQILTDSEYFLLNSQYEQARKIKNKNIIIQIEKTLDECISCCNDKNTKLNTKTQSLINQTKQQLTNILNNLTATFNISINQNYNENKLNIFTLGEHVTDLINLHHQWILIEEKEYYKNIAIKNNSDLIFILKNIFSALKDSFVLTFKHM